MLVSGAAWLYGQKQSVDLRGWKADLAHDYLAAPIARDEKGNPISRAMIIDAMINQALKGAGTAQTAPPAK